MTGDKKSENRNLKKIQARLKRQDISVTYNDIRDEILNSFPDVDLTQISDKEVDSVCSSFITKERVNTTGTEEIVLSQREETEAKSKALTTRGSKELEERKPNSITQLAPQEAIEIIREISEDDTSRNQALARQLLEEADRKTTSIVSLIEAMPQIEAELLRRKLQAMKRSQVDYGAVVEGYFQGSKKLSDDITSLVSEYGISI